MKIISKFNDYYDGVSQYGIDENLVYVRKEASVLNPDDPEFKEFRQWLFSISRGDFYADSSVIGFCGKVYFHCRAKIHTGYLRIGVAEDIYTHDSLLKFIEDSNASKREINALINSLGTKKNFWGRRTLSLESFDDFVVEFGDKRFDNLFIKYNTPVFHLLSGPGVRDDELILNPRLDDFGFAKVVDPFTAHQELSMYLGSVLVTQKKLGTKVKKRGTDWVDPLNSDDFSDTVKRDSKGFDAKSFKKEKTKKY